MKLFLFFLALSHLTCQERPAPQAQAVAVPAVQAGQTVLFLGDSITWQTLYTTYIEQYFTVRYPDKKFRFINRGVRGDTAAEAIARLERDVAADRPDLVVVMLGMNDGGYKGYNKGLLKFYLGNLEKLVGLLKEKTKAKIILVTTTCVGPVDYKTERYNKMLSAMAAGVVDLGMKLQVPVIDLFPFFSEKLQQARAQKPPLGLMLDPIHPGPAGQLVIAHHLLTFLDPKPVALKPIMVNLEPGQTGFELSLNRKSVHFPRAVSSLVPFQERFNRQLLVVKGVSGPVKLQAGDAELGVFTPGQLASGIDIFSLSNSPWVRDAERHHRLLQERWFWFYCLWDPNQAGDEVLQEISPLGKRAPRLTRAEAQKAFDAAVSKLKELKPDQPAAYPIKVLPGK
jgi:lysophospholipase L1-like esterase